jgi:Tol biopolymer transport system component
MRLVRRKACGEDWSSAGRLLASHGHKLIEMDPDGGNVVKITVGRRVNDADWSPNGRRIAFECGGYAHKDICVIRSDGTRLRDLTNSRRIDWSPSWSPDGSRIVWAPSTNTERRRADLWRMRADGTGRFRLTTTPRIDEYEPDWTP